MSSSPLSDSELVAVDRWWRAANYVAVGQIYLLDAPPADHVFRPELIEPRLLGHWGTTPGLNLLWAHLCRVIRRRDRDVLFVCGPGHGGPAVVASTWLEGSYSEVYPAISQDREGMRRLFRQFSSRAASQATPRRKRPVRSTKAASSATPWPTPTAPRSTTRTCSWPA